MLHLGKNHKQTSNTVAKGPKFRPQNTKGALQNSVRSEKLAGRIFFRFAKKSAEKGPNFFEEYYSHKKLKISAENRYLYFFVHFGNINTL
jgi:hypothetical protein